MDKSIFFRQVRFLKYSLIAVFLLVAVHDSLFASPEAKKNKDPLSVEKLAEQTDLKSLPKPQAELEKALKTPDEGSLDLEGEDSFTHVSIEAKEVIEKLPSENLPVLTEQALPASNETDVSSVSSKILDQFEKTSSAAEVSEKLVLEKDEIVLPGDKPIHILDSQDSGLRGSGTELNIAGMGLTYSQKPFLTQRPKEPVDSYSEFTEMTSKIFWFAFFQEGRSHEERMTRPKFSVEWFAPDGQLVYYGSFRANIAYPDYVRTGLPLSRLGMPDVTGRWRVRVTSENKLVDERQFMVTRAG